MSQAENIPTTAEKAASTIRQEFPWAGLMTAVCWSFSPILIREGLEDLDSPLIGVTVGMLVNVIVYGGLLYFQRNRWQGKVITRDALNWQILAGIFVGLSTWARWVALDKAEVAVVIAIGRINVPIVLLLSIFMLDKKQERITPRLWIGAALIVAGSLILTFAD